MSRGPRPARSLAGVVTGLTAGLWLVPAAAADPSDTGPVLPPIPRSVQTDTADPAAVPMVHWLVDEVLDNVATGTRQKLMDAEIRVYLIPRSRSITELPPWQALRRRPVPDSDPGDTYGEARSYDDVRGVGPAVCGTGPLNVAVGEEQVVTFTDGAHRSPAPERLGRSLVHELGHAVECGLTGAQRAKLAAAYAAARQRSPDHQPGDHPTYSVSNQREYFAEGTASWFGIRDTGKYRRAWLAEHDPGLYELMADVYSVPRPVVTCDGQRATAVVAAGAAPFMGTPGPDVIVGSDGRDVVNGGGGADVICGRGDDDVVYGGYGPDRLLGELGNDMLAGGADADRVIDTHGEDRLAGGAGDDVLDASDRGDVRLSDWLDGTEASDRCTHDANDKVEGCRASGP